MLIYICKHCGLYAAEHGVSDFAIFWKKRNQVVKKRNDNGLLNVVFYMDNLNKMTFLTEVRTWTIMMKKYA